jgi:glycosyltransferase involved in cell wall biosynthesis
MNFAKLKIAIVADWLTNLGGAEEVVAALVKIFPHADLYAPVAYSRQIGELAKLKINTSYLQKLPSPLRRNHQLLVAQLPQAVESFDLSAYDLVISSSCYVAKGVLTQARTLHVSYIHTPARFLWEEAHNYLNKLALPQIFRSRLKKLFHRLRIWDLFSASRPDFLIANSYYTQQKIQSAWRRDSQVIFPPVDFKHFSSLPPEANLKKDYYLWVGRLAPQKNIELLIATFKQLPTKKLLIAGQGKLEKPLRKMAAGARNIQFLGYIPKEQLPVLYANARFTLFPPVEDAGIVPLESLAAGTPVIAKDQGGVLTSLNSNVAEFFTTTTPKSLIEAINRAESRSFSKQKLQDRAQEFEFEQFKYRLKSQLTDYYQSHFF